MDIFLPKSDFFFVFHNNHVLDIEFDFFWVLSGNEDMDEVQIENTSCIG